MKPIPTPIRIGPIDHQVIELDSVEAMADRRLGDYNSFHGHVIRVKIDGENDWSIADTLIHEILHGIYRTYSVSDDDGEERVVSVMATGLTQVFRDNPRLVKWLHDLTRPR